MEQEVRVTWREEMRTLTLEGEPVLEYTLSWPEVENAGLGGRWISKYYTRLAESWRRRWEREVYWQACLELAARREAARPFNLWRGGLAGETVLLGARADRGPAAPPGCAGGTCGASGRGHPSPCAVCFGGSGAGRDACGRR